VMTYNPTGLVQAVSGVLALADYTSLGEVSRTVVSMTAGRFVTEERSYEDGTRRLARQVVARVAPNWGATTTATPVPVRDASYSYTPAGDLWSVTDTGAVDGIASSRSECFRYDGLGRVTEAWASSTACPAPVGGSPSVGAPALTSTLTGWGRYHARYTYDTLGNRTSVTQRDDAATRTRSWSYPAPGAGVVRPHAPTSTSDQVGTAAPTTQALTYTAAGQQTNRLKASASGSGGPAHTPAVTGQVVAYDAEGRVSTVVTGSSMTRWAYDADGGLLVKDDGVTRTVYLGAGGGGREISRVTATGIRSTTEVRSVGGVSVTETGTEPVPAHTTGFPASARPAQPVSTRVVTITDPHTTGVLQLNGVTLAETGRRYADPFGSPIASPGVSARAWTGDRGYGNHPTDIASGLTQVGARVYDPAAGMFTSPDPVINPGNPKQMHGVYAYAYQNPLAMSDPTGLEPRPIHAKAGQGKPAAMAKSNQASAARYTGQATAHATARAQTASAARYTGQAATARPTSRPTQPTSGSTLRPTAPANRPVLVPVPTARPAGSTRPATPTQYLVWRDPAPALIYALTVQDPIQCTRGSAEGCAWTAAGLLPYGKLGKVAKLGVAARAADNVARSADDLKRFPDVSSLRGAEPDTVLDAIPDHWIITTPNKVPDGIRFANPNAPGQQIIYEPGWPGATGVHGGPYLRISDGVNPVDRIPLSGNPAL